MAVFNLFSKRQKLARGEMPDVYVYDDLSGPLRVQIIHIIQDAFGVDGFGSEHAAGAYAFVHNVPCREAGVFKLLNSTQSHDAAVFNYFLGEKSVEKALDVVELSFSFIQKIIGPSSSYQYNTRPKISADEAVAELNERFKEHGVGYQYESGEIIRVDSLFLHVEAVKQTLALLSDKRFSGANDEFLKAHEHYRHGRHKECLVDALKAFESTMKTICVLRGWPTQPTDTAKNLISTCMTKGLFPTYFESQFSSVRSLLESGIPTVRNKNGGHGQGTVPITVPGYLAQYALNLTATTILFMLEAYKAMK